MVATEPKARYLVRAANLADAAEIARLAGELGYPAEGKAMASRLERLLDRAQDLILVAFAGENENRLLGWIAAEARTPLVATPRVEIMGLVVDETARKSGVGKRLVAAVEDWAKEHGVRDVVVRSNVLREESHPFYEHLGYHRAKSQHVYHKEL